MEKRQLRIDVLGASFTIQSEESAEHLAKVSTYLREKVEEVKARYSFATPLTLALLAALNIADELVKERAVRPARATAAAGTASAAPFATPPFATPHASAASSAASRQIEEIAAGLIEQIDDALAPDDDAPGT